MGVCSSFNPRLKIGGNPPIILNCLGKIAHLKGHAVHDTRREYSVRLAETHLFTYTNLTHDRWVGGYGRGRGRDGARSGWPVGEMFDDGLR